MVTYATAKDVSREELQEFLASAHRAVLITLRAGGGLQTSPVTCGIDAAGSVVIASYPQRAKVANIRRNQQVSLCVMSEDWNDPYVHLDGEAEIVDLPEAEEPLVEYFRSVAGEHPDWDEYRSAMVEQGKCLIRVRITDWGPLATGGFPPPK